MDNYVQKHRLAYVPGSPPSLRSIFHLDQVQPMGSKHRKESPMIATGEGWSWLALHSTLQGAEAFDIKPCQSYLHHPCNPTRPVIIRAKAFDIEPFSSRICSCCRVHIRYPIRNGDRTLHLLSRRPQINQILIIICRTKTPKNQTPTKSNQRQFTNHL
ncbi:hypothetical protein Droror1_Dr00027970 [Drosera rotundifolia]